MTERKDLIREIADRARKVQMINTLLSIVVTLLVCIAFYTTVWSLGLKKEAEVLLTEKTALLTEKTELLSVKDSLVETLKISEENLEGEKARLELVKVAYDSIRQVQLEQLQQLEESNIDELWEYAEKENTIQGYTDYLKLKGDNGRNVIDKVKTLMQNTGYVQVQESNGTLHIKPSPNGEGLWESKSARSIRYGVIGIDRNSKRTGDVILQNQPFVILQDSIWSGKTRWAKIAY